MTRSIATMLGALALAGCDGPNEEAGERGDAATNQASGIGDGPGERIGEIEDRTQRDQARATEGRADVLEDQADSARATADEAADRLEEQAERLRTGAEGEADALDQQADAVRRR